MMKMFSRPKASCLLAAACALLVTGCGGGGGSSSGSVEDYGRWTWSMPLGYPERSYVSQVAKQFAELASGEDGEFFIEPRYRGSLVRASDIMQAVADGKVPLGERLLSAEGGRNALYSYDSLPFLARDLDANDRLARLARPYISQALENEGLRLLYSIPFLPQGIYTNRRIDELADLRGLRLRVYSDNSTRVARLLGMQPVFVENADVVKAIESDQVDAVLTSAVSGAALELWKYYDYFQAINAWMPRAYIFANEDFWSRLSPADQARFTAAARAAESYGLHIAQLSEETTTLTLQRNGIEVVRPTPALRQELRKATASMQFEWLKESGAAGKAILDSFTP